MRPRTCKGLTKAGSGCKSPFVDRDGYCPAHAPDGAARMRHRGQKGGDATRRRFSGAGLSPDRLGPLESAGAEPFPGSALHPEGDRWIFARSVTSGGGAEGDASEPERLILVQNFFEESRQVVPE